MKIVKRVSMLLMSIAILLSMSMTPCMVNAMDYSRPTDWEYDKTLWDKTEYEKVGVFYKLESRSQIRGFYYNNVVGIVYLYPTFFQPNRRIDGYIFQVAAFKVKSCPQVFTVGKTQYVGMTQNITINMTNVREEDEMLMKSISPAVELESTLSTVSYDTVTGDTWGSNGEVGVKNGVWTFGGGVKYTKTTRISNSTEYQASALSFMTRDYVASNKTAEWDYYYRTLDTDSYGASKINAYATSTTWQTGMLSWKCPYNSNYYFTNFQFIVSASYGVAKASDNSRVTKGGQLRIAYGKGTSGYYGPYGNLDATDFAK